MIRLSNSALLAVFDDGTRRVFEFEELQSRLLQSFISCGIAESWIAEDVALAVEYVLQRTENEEKIYSVPEINSCVVKVLEEAGFPEVAESFRNCNSVHKINIKPEKELLTSLISKHLGAAGGELERITGSVQNACRKLDIDSAPPAFLVELARYYRGKEFELKTADFAVPKIEKSPWCVSGGEIMAEISGDAKSLFENGILSVGPISRLFPSVKISLKLGSLAGFFNMEKPVTELALAPCLKILAGAIDEILKISEKKYSEFRKDSEKLPVYLKIADTAFFSEKYLGVKWPDSAKCIKDILSFLL